MADLSDTSPQLTVHADESGPEPVISVAGELDLATAPQLTAAAKASLDSNPQRVVFDLSELRFMDSSGLRVLLEIANQAEVSIRAASDAVRRIIDSTGVQEILKIEA